MEGRLECRVEGRVEGSRREGGGGKGEEVESGVRDGE